MIDIRYYTIIVRKDRTNNIFESIFKDYSAPKNEDEDLFAFYTMSENDVEEIIKRLSTEAGLTGYNKEKKLWEDFVLVTSVDGIENGECDWLELKIKRSKQDIDLVSYVSFRNR